MSKNGIYSPFKPIENENRDFGVKVTDRYELGQHSSSFHQGPVTSIINQSNTEELLIYGWSSKPESNDTYMYDCHHCWSMSKLYHTYAGGENFIQFWTRASSYCKPFRVLYVAMHGNEFQNLAEIAYGSYDNKLFEILCDGQGGYLLIERELSDIESMDEVNVIEDRCFSLDAEESVKTI